MRKLFFVVAVFTALHAQANSVWVEQNKLVGEIGGWRIYAKEQSPNTVTPSADVFTLNQAIERMLRHQLDSVNYLPGSESIVNYYLLSPAQRSALQQRYSIIYETSRAYYELVAQREKLVHMENVLEAVEAASELTSRMYKVGNVNELKLLTQKKDLYKKRLEYKSLQAKYLDAKERFIQRMNFDSRDLKTDVEQRLPDPPKDSRKLTEKEQRAIDLGVINNPGTVQTRSTGRVSYDSYLEKYYKAKTYKDGILPTQKKISEENLLRYNGMLIDVFHLLEDAENQSKAVIEYIDANLAFLIQSVRLEKDLVDAQMDYSNINVR
ncbi:MULTISPECIES: TolC family protein [unclassified Polynucleobacter]|uniref:TolC family protein n=1 Tax=unclassified Polynucleobacter TaxID=2640945 RepID=UPI0008CBEE6B|nr:MULTISPECIES: TolC family protein [unclassified Polynucleobacter]OHC10935.1 MAG: hypothetical protein A2X74_03680 [Polynucleobacter sp. GWA2_45_21]HBK44480.1 hypothetical protein [Polynucleobacter sp.]